MTNSETKKFSQNVSSSYHLEDRNKNVPKLRFKGYNEEWKHLNFKSITTMIKDGTHGSYNDLSEGIPLLSAKDIDNGKVIIPDDCRRISLSDYNDIYKNYSLKINDILLTIVGTIGRVALVSDITNKYAFQRSVGILRANEYNNPQFILYLLQTDFIKKQFYSKVNQSAQGGIYLDTLGKIDFKIPTLPEQEKIASFLTLIDKKIEKQKELVELLKKYKRGLLSQIFSQKLRFKDDNGNDYPEWKETRLEKILKIKHGKSQKGIECEAGKYPILATGGQIGRTNSYLWNKPCVLIGRKGTIDKPQYMETPFWTVDTLFYSEVFKENNAKYLYYLFNTINWKKYDESTGVPSLSAKTIERIKVTLSMNSSEQHLISKFLSKFDDKIRREESLLNYLQTYKKGLLQQLFI